MNSNLASPRGTDIKISGLSFAYGRREVLKDISLVLPAGRLLGLMGPNGSGKTTLFRCCLGFLKPLQGTIELAGRRLDSYRPRELAAKIAYVPQEHRPAFPFTVREIAAMGRTPGQGWLPVLSKSDHRKVDEALERLNLSQLADENCSHLSGGQRKLVLMARALAQDADLLFLDEPTSSLDFSNQLLVWDAVRTLAAEGIGCVASCHDPNHILWFCDEAAALKEGRLLAAGSVREIVTQTLLENLYSRPVSFTGEGSAAFIGPVL
ncbi:MAG: ABC transporter ATP-binding protein [Deltaproteobacteria bacterium]|nr:ABC transporter ATP-binding protein [Deltaproteobacteria bacterium]